MEIKKSDFQTSKEAEQSGKMVSMTGIVEPIRTELNNQLSQYFRENMPKYNGSFSEEDGEEVLYAINEYFKDQGIDKHLIDFPITSGTDLHLIPVNENIQLKLIVADEYYGDGDCAKYVMANYFVINNEATIDDVDQLINFVKNVLGKYASILN